ncbi:MAG: hypothetical protein R6U88_04050 [Candidatus Bipolaricaulota bacterium]
MKSCKHGKLLLALAMVLVPCGADGESYVNTASLFELGASARALGMGGTFLAVADDAGAVYYNPARLPQVEQATLSSLFTRPHGAYSYGTLSAARRGWGAQLLALDSGPLEERDLYGTPGPAFRHTEAGLLLAGGVQAGGGVSVGLQAKLYSPALPNRGYGASLSPALSFREGPRAYALVWRNALSTDLCFANHHSEPWMRDLAVGFSWRAGSTVYAVDFTERLITRGDMTSVRAGVESRQFDPLILRAGTHREGSSFGASVYWAGLRLDLAYVLHYALPDSYYVSLNYRWEGTLFGALVAW